MTDDYTKVPDIDLWFKYRELRDKNDVQANAVGNEIQRRHSTNPQKYTLQSILLLLIILLTYMIC